MQANADPGFYLTERYQNGGGADVNGDLSFQNSFAAGTALVEEAFSAFGGMLMRDHGDGQPGTVSGYAISSVKSPGVTFDFAGSGSLPDLEYGYLMMESVLKMHSR
ncbi:MAG: hypothetical protein CSA26_05765 [Desulfobacterales bacterium]|nr:MAG: hypothetical protein CSA26_05765 [Desulfobacterales bacterium]